MCDFTQFVVGVPIPSCTSAIIQKCFVQNMLLKFSICSSVVIIDDTHFKEAFTSMCDALHLRYDIVAKRNCTVVSMDRFHRSLNKAQTIAPNDRDTVRVFTEAGITVAYAWNSVPINGTDRILWDPYVTS